VKARAPQFLTFLVRNPAMGVDHADASRANLNTRDFDAL
jgi:hypothetical protein